MYLFVGDLDIKRIFLTTQKYFISSIGGKFAFEDLITLPSKINLGQLWQKCSNLI